MAVTRHGTVIKIAADNDTITGTFKISSILYKAGASTPSALLKVTDTNGMILWEADSTTTVHNEVEMYLPEGTYHFDLAGTGTAVYLYLCAD